MTKAVFLTLASSLFLSACGLFGGGGDNKEIIFDTAVGPETRQQVRTLPGTLEGDQENKRHSRVTNAPEDMDPKQ